MRFREIMLFERWVHEQNAGPFLIKFDDHLYDRMIPREVTNNEIRKIVRRIPYVKDKIRDMQYFEKFYLRDNETGAELGCRFIEDTDGTRFIGVITTVKNDHIRQAENPIIIVNPEFTKPHIGKNKNIAEPVLTEGATDILYHYTGLTGAEDILKNGEFGLSVIIGVEKRKVPKGYDFFLSTTRSRTGDYHRTTANIAVMFVLDGRAIGQRYKVVPVDYWDQSWLSTHIPGSSLSSYRTRESEDRILSTDPTMSLKYAREIHILIKDLGRTELARAQIRQLIDLAEQRNLPHWVYFNEKAWRLQDKRRALLPQHEQEYFRGEVPTRKDYTGTQWEPMNYLHPWDQLLSLNPTQRDELGKQARDLVRRLEFGPRSGDDLGLSQDLFNARKPYDTGRASAVKILQFMRKNRLDIPGLVQYLAKKWERKNIP